MATGEDQREHCAACGFDSDLYSRPDTITSQTIIVPVLRAATEGLTHEQVNQRPDASTWSIAEYVDHVREMAFGNRFAIECTLAGPGVDLGPLPADTGPSEQRSLDLETALSAAERQYEQLRELLGGLDDEAWEHACIVDGHEHTVDWFGRHVLHDGMHHVADVGRLRHRFGLGAATETGHISQLSVSNGGVPKTAVDSVAVSARGVSGDAQNDRRNHGRPLQAVCLWSDDVIASLRGEGHRIEAGNAGENITVAGIDWAALRPGTRIDIGAVPMLISAHAIPCSKNAQWFADGNFRRILHDNHPGFSRLYAIPLATGTISTGDPVTVEP